jgi:hypothetical protein
MEEGMGASERSWLVLVMMSGKEREVRKGGSRWWCCRKKDD